MLKKTETDAPPAPLEFVSSVPYQLRIPLLYPYWDAGCFDLMQVLCRPSQPPWVHVCRGPVMSGQPHFCTYSWPLEFIIFLPLFLNDPEPWLRDEVCYRCPIRCWTLHCLFFSMLWPVVGLYIKQHQLQKETLPLKAESCVNAWL